MPLLRRRIHQERSGQTFSGVQNISNIHLEGLSPVILDDQPATFQILPFLLSLKEKEPSIYPIKKSFLKRQAFLVIL